MVRELWGTAMNATEWRKSLRGKMTKAKMLERIEFLEKELNSILNDKRVLVVSFVGREMDGLKYTVDRLPSQEPRP